MKVQDGPWEICESLNLPWSYHLRAKHSGSRQALCGRQIMATGIQLSTWGRPAEHIPERYCLKCEELALKHAEETEG